jgi:hypothetical protein
MNCCTKLYLAFKSVFGVLESFKAWKLIGAALAVGKHRALKVTGANAAWGRNYSREFGKWMKANGFDRMPKSTRSVAIELHENAAAMRRGARRCPRSNGDGLFTR